MINLISTIVSVVLFYAQLLSYVAALAFAFIPTHSHADDYSSQYWNTWAEEQARQDFAEQQENEYDRVMREEAARRYAPPPPHITDDWSQTPNMNEYIMETGCDMYWPMCRNRWR